MTRCAIYIRKSREEQGKQSHRLTVQREQLPAHAQAQGWQVEIYDDGHASAARGKAEDLVERGRLERDLRAGRVNVILCIELSRLSRDDSLQDYVAWLHLCSEHRVRLATPSRILDPAQHSDWMLLLMEGGFSSVEMRVLQGRMKEGRAEAFRAGKYLAGNPPIPYRYDKSAGNLIIDQAKIEIFRRMMRLAEHNSAKEVARITGLPHISVRRAIADDRLLLYQALRLDPDTGEIIPGQWPPVIDADQAARIQASRINKVSGYHRRHAGSLLTNLGRMMICGYCGRSIRAWAGGRRRTDGTRQVYYGCTAKEGRDCPKSRMVQQAQIDTRLVNHLLGTLADQDALRYYWQLAQSGNDPTAELAELTQGATALQQQKQRLVAAIAEGIIDFADAKNQRLQIEQRLQQIKNRQAELAAAGTAEPDFDALTLSGADWALLDTDERRAYIRAALERVTMYASYLMLEYRFPIAEDGRNTARINLPPPPKPGRRPGKTKAPG